MKSVTEPQPLITRAALSTSRRTKSNFLCAAIIRRYQIKTIDTLCLLFDNKRLRKFLLEMETGTGKTLLCTVLIRRFLITRKLVVSYGVSAPTWNRFLKRCASQLWFASRCWRRNTSKKGNHHAKRSKSV